MKFEIADILICPNCSSRLDLHPFKLENGDVKDGIFKCDGCNGYYFIVDFIPRILPSTLYHNDRFVRKYKTDIRFSGVKIKKNHILNQNFLSNLKIDTMEKFGFEWIEYGRFGWDDPIFNIEQEKSVFMNKSLLKPKDFEGKLVLDAGCGNGRYSYWAAKYGAKVIGIDLGWGVESAYNNTKDIEDINIIQGDLFNLPFREDFFDVIFSIGVLMHTGNAKLSTKSLITHLKKDGVISIHMYHKGNFIYEIVDSYLRKYTSKLSIEQLISFTRKMHKMANTLDGIKFLRFINLLIRLEKHSHCIFDWYSAPIATHHTYNEVYNWFSEFDIVVVKDNKFSSNSLISSLMKKINPPKSLTVIGQKADNNKTWKIST